MIEIVKLLRLICLYLRRERHPVINKILTCLCVKKMETHLRPSPTLADQQDAINTSFERRKLADYNWYLKHKPNIMSRVTVEIHPDRVLQSRNHDYRDHAIHVRIKGTPAFCRAVACNKYYPRGRVCNKHSNLQIFKSGNTTVTACEHACSNLYKPTPLYNPAEAAIAAAEEAAKPPKKETNEVDGNRVFWSDECDACITGFPEVYAMAIDDYRRTSDHTTPHTDTIGTGYDIDENQLFRHGEDYATYYKMNQYYCDDFALTLKGGQCQATLGERILGFFLGDTITHLMKYFVTNTLAGKNIYTVKSPKVPKISQEEINRLTTQNDQGKYDDSVYCIKPTVTLSELGFRDGLYHMYWSTAAGFPGNLIEPLIFFKELTPLTSPPDPPFVTLPQPTVSRSIWSDLGTLGTSALGTFNIAGGGFTPINTDGILSEVLQYKKPIERPHGLPGAPKHLRLDRFGMRIQTEYDLLGLRPRVASTRDASDALIDPAELESTFLQIGKIILEGTHSVVDTIIVNKLIKSFFKHALPAIARAIERAGMQMVKFVMKNVIKNVLVKIITKTVVNVVAKALLRLSALGSLPFIGIVLAVLGVLDLILSIVDPLRMADLQDQSALDLNAKLEIEQNKILYGMGTWEYSPAMWMESFKFANYVPDDEAPVDTADQDGNQENTSNNVYKFSQKMQKSMYDNRSVNDEDRDILNDPQLQFKNNYLAVDKHSLILVRKLNKKLTSNNDEIETKSNLSERTDKQNDKKYNIHNPHPVIGLPLSKVTVNPNDDFILEIQYQTMYLMTLKVNSEGQKIDMENEGQVDTSEFAEQARKHSATLPSFSSSDFEMFLSEYSEHLNTCNYGIYAFAAYLVIVPIIVTLLSYAKIATTTIVTTFCICSIVSMLIIGLYTRNIYRPNAEIVKKGTRRHNRILDHVNKIIDVHGHHAIPSSTHVSVPIPHQWI
ncbi:P74 protein 1 [Dolichomitus sp. PSUC_FEM 10030005]|nr:P74 protein 1 [Dolichomitus sp. PSUC_FEM 10030005]